jgi:GNAT superfamily N-acetyltransferase
MTVAIEGPLTNVADVCEPIFQQVPEWFSIISAVRRYLREMRTEPSFLAKMNGQIVGFLTLKWHFDVSAEVLAMAVLPLFHGRGIGTRLMNAAEQWLQSQQVQFLQVKTLGPSHPDPHYGQTRSFYRSMGFRPLEELADYWGPANPCLIMIKQLATADAAE